MISIIISSAKKPLLAQVKKNIADTIGVEHQIIAFDNSDGSKGICQIYNQGIREAQYDVLCFMHEDVALHTPNWGVIVEDIFKNDPEVGLIGLAGSSYRPITPTGWNGMGNEGYYINLLQRFKFAEKETKREYHNPGDKNLAPVAVVDGVWFCTTKVLAQKHGFDERFAGFHVYDMDFSLTIGQEKTVAVTFDVLLEHFSEGSYNVDWLKDTIKLFEKWHHILPINLEGLSRKQVIYIERRTFKHFLKQVAESNLPISAANKVLWKAGKFRKLDLSLFFKLQFYVILAWFKSLFGGTK
jgi:glycosyltransferase involved in cell wall biosynthesis